MATINFECSVCSKGGSDAQSWGHFVYLYKGTEVPVCRRLGFCSSCDSFVAMESFSSLDKYADDMIESYRVASSPWTKIKTLFSRNKRGGDDLYDLAEKALFLSIAARRKGDERCLRCLSADVEAFNGKMDLYYEGVFVGESRTSFHHPGCGGEFIAKGSESRFSIRFDKKTYLVGKDGQLEVQS